MNNKQYEYIAVDFDGTLNEHKFPEIGEPKEDVIAFVCFHHLLGTKIILHTCRENDEAKPYLTEALDWCKEHNVPIDAVNENPWVPYGKRKIYADIYVDDRAVNADDVWR